jgi:antitoxin component YwqK of YwqJK toxin-antitoxin module
VKGKRHGIEKRYYETGVLEWENPYVNGERHGIVKHYYKSGVLYRETSYVYGKIHGIDKVYNKDNANIENLTLYEEGQRVKYKEVNYDTEY